MPKSSGQFMFPLRLLIQTRNVDMILFLYCNSGKKTVYYCVILSALSLSAEKHTGLLWMFWLALTSKISVVKQEQLAEPHT